MINSSFPKFKKKESLYLNNKIEGVPINTNFYYIVSHKQYVFHVLVLSGVVYIYKRIWYLAQIDANTKRIYNLQVTGLFLDFINKNPTLKIANITDFNKKLIYNPFISQKSFLKFCAKNKLSYEEGLFAFLFSRLVFLEKVSLLLIPFQGLVYLKTITFIYSKISIIFLANYLPYTLIFCIYLLILIVSCLILQKIFLILNKMVNYSNRSERFWSAK